MNSPHRNNCSTRTVANYKSVSWLPCNNSFIFSKQHWLNVCSSVEWNGPLWEDSVPPARVSWWYDLRVCDRNLLQRMPVWVQTHTHTHTHTRTHTHTCLFLLIVGTLQRRNGFYTILTAFSIALHLNLPLTGNFLHFYFLKKNSFCMIYNPFEIWGHGEMSS